MADGGKSSAKRFVIFGSHSSALFEVVDEVRLIVELMDLRKRFVCMVCYGSKVLIKSDNTLHFFDRSSEVFFHICP